ncbi:hypothetical protein QCA50_010054 [Cerrena zonata]|uniref:SH3 domain-containing protein n=1 Tax=Cerrena zonata TaxID=2478898 RepID=A0AAW0GAN4_9APHY
MAVTRNVMFEPSLSPGGGATEMAVSVKLAEKAKTIEGVAQWPYQAVADAFEVIPRTLIQNCGGNPIKVLSQLRAKHANGEHTFGIDGDLGKVVDMNQYGVWEPEVIKQQSIKTGIESACLLLRVDDIVKTVYSWSGEQEEDLGFVENEIVDVYSIVDDSWWKGKLRRNNAEGIFPKDFVEIIEDSIPQSSSSRSISQLNSKQNTPVKDQELRSSKNGTPNGFYNKSKFPNKKINPLSNVDLNNSYEDYDYSYDNSFDNSFGHINRSSNGYSPQKLRASNSNLSPRKQQINTQDDLIEVHTPAQAQKEKEKAQIKMLQQQQQQLQQQLQEQQRLLKKQQYDQQIRTRQQQDNYRNSIAVTPDYHYNNTYAKQKPKQMKQRPISQYHQYANNPYEFNSPAGLMPHSPPYQEKSHSYTDVNELSPSKSPSKYQPVFQNNTIESFSPEASHNQKRRNAQKYSNHFYDPIYDTAPEIVDDGLDDPEYEDLLLAKQRIELEYQRIKQLEKRKKTALKSTPPPPPIPKYSDPIYDHSGESSYVSEDLLSSKKNQSRENLSKKLTNYVTDEDTYEVDNNLYRDASPPPPPPPKHGYGINASNGYEPIANINQKSRSRMPYDPNDFEVSPLRQQYSDDLYGISDMSPEDLKQSIKSLQSDVLNLSELSATSAGSFMRHKQDKQLQHADYKMRGLSLNEEDEEDKDDEDEARDQMPDRGLMESMFEDKKKPSLFKKFLNKRKGVDNYLGMDDEMDWATLKTDLNPKLTTNELSLCQVFWKKNDRIAKIKAVLPEKESIGVLQVFAGPKGLQEHFENIHELAVVIPLSHNGTSKPVLQHPSKGLNSGSGLMNQDFKLIVKSPSGKHYRLAKDDPLSYGTYEVNIKCQEVGTYTGLVIGDSGSSWTVFAQWECFLNSF